MIQLFKGQTDLFSASSLTTILFSAFLLFAISCKDNIEAPVPSIDSFTPNSGIVGTIVTISGTNFSPTSTKNIVKFNETAAMLTSVTPTTLTVTVPSGASTGKISVIVDGEVATSGTDFTVFNSPEITSILPSNGLPGTSITIAGKNFSTTLTENIVKFNALEATVTGATSTSLTATVPAGAITGKISVTVHDLTAVSSDDFVVPPTVTNFSPTSGIIGSTVTITGTGFNTSAANNIVKFNNKGANITAATATSLTVTVPSGALTDKITVTVSGQTATSANDFVVLPTITSFSPVVGAIGSTVTITGTGFSATAANNLVKFNSTAASIITATTTSISVVVPIGTTTGKITVTVGDNTVMSVTNYEVVIEAIVAGGSDWDQGNVVTVDGSQNTYVSGSFRGTANFGSNSLTSAGSDDIFIAKYNSTCDLIWLKQSGGLGSEVSRSIVVDNSGNIYMTGHFSGTANFGTISLTQVGGTDGFVTKFDASGNVVWAKQFSSGLYDSGSSVRLDGTGNPYVTGTFSLTALFGTVSLTSAGGTDIFVAKYNPTTGDITWAKRFGGLDDQEGNSLTIDSSGDAFVGGGFFGVSNFGTTTFTSAGGLDAFLIKLDSSGDIVWAKQISGSGWENVLSLTIDANGSCYAGGYFSNTTSFGSSTLSATVGEDVFVAKYNSSGEVIWAKSAGGSDNDNVRSIAIDPSNNVYITGSFGGTILFGDKSLTSNGIFKDVFVARYNSNGDVLWAKQAGGADFDEGQSVIVDASGTINVVGNFRGTGITTFGTTSFNGSGNDDVFLWKIRQ